MSQRMKYFLRHFYITHRFTKVRNIKGENSKMVSVKGTLVACGITFLYRTHVM